MSLNGGGEGLRSLDCGVRARRDSDFTTPHQIMEPSTEVESMSLGYEPSVLAAELRGRNW